MIVGERKEPFTFERLFSNSSAIFGEKEKLEAIEDVDLIVPPSKPEPSYKIREALLEARRLGRPLTDEEMERFRAD